MSDSQFGAFTLTIEQLETVYRTLTELVAIVPEDKLHSLDCFESMRIIRRAINSHMSRLYFKAEKAENQLKLMRTELERLSAKYDDGDD